MTADPQPRRWAAAGTLRFRITAVATLAVLLVLAAAGVGLVLAQRAQLTENLDDAVAEQADAVIAQVQAREPVTRARLPTDDVVVQVVGADDEVLVASGSLAGLPPLTQASAGAAITTELPQPVGGRVRLLSRTLDGTTVHAAGSLDDVDESTRTLVLSLLLGLPLSAALLAGVVWWSVGRSLRPVEAIRARVEQISGAHLDRRVPVPPTDDEIARLAGTMNDMLGRLDTAADRQRRFVADASHELRSPLARMRSELEIDAAHPASADVAATHRSLLDETITLQHLVDDLLLLARGDAGALDGGPRLLVDLDHVVTSEAHRLRASEGVHVDTADLDPVQVLGDQAQLRRTIGNLLDNATRHARTRVTVTLSATPDGRAVLAVSDDGSGVPPGRADEVFRRFTRLDDARGAAHGGAGLGLAIARDIAERHGGHLTLDVHHGPGARFVLSLPMTPDGTLT